MSFTVNEAAKVVLALLEEYRYCYAWAPTETESRRKERELEDTFSFSGGIGNDSYVFHFEPKYTASGVGYDFVAKKNGSPISDVELEELADF